MRLKNVAHHLLNFLLLIVLMGYSLGMTAQRQRNYVYIFDCTESMERDNHIWQPAKEFLKNDLSQLDKNANVTVILFHQDAPTPIKFKAKDMDWNRLESKCDELIKESKNTGICNAWDKGLKFIDPARNNYFYLFTDGKENVIKPNGTAAVCKRIQEWCMKTSSNDYAFFVALPSKTLLNSPEIKQIQNATKLCNRTYFISGSIAPFGSFDKTNFTQNSHSTKNIEVGFSDYGTFDANVKCDNPYYSVKLKDGKVYKGKAIFEIKQIKQPKANTQVHFKVTANDKDMHICNPDMFINIDTRKLNNIDFAQPSGADGEYDAGTAETYSDFLFFKGKDFNKLSVHLGSAFNEQAKKSGCSMTMTIKSPDKCKIYYEGKLIHGNFQLTPQNSNSELTVEVPHTLAEADFYIDLHGISPNIETVNSELGNRYSSKIHFIHNRCWHPVKTVLFWLVIVIFILLSVWFVVLKWIVYPRIRLSRIELKCEAKKYYENKRINSARKVIVGPEKGRQSYLNRFFTGRIVYISNKDIWPYQWEMLPKGRKKACKVNLHGKYMVNPITNDFDILHDYILTNKDNKDKILIKL